MTINNRTFECLQGLATLVKSIAQFDGRVQTAINVSQAKHWLGVLTPPAALVIYEGRTAVGQDVPVRGLSSEMVFGVYILVPNSAFGLDDDFSQAATDYLELTAARLLDAVSPTGHKWKFASESFVEQGKTADLWRQRWTTVRADSPTYSNRP